MALAVVRVVLLLLLPLLWLCVVWLIFVHVT